MPAKPPCVVIYAQTAPAVGTGVHDDHVRNGIDRTRPKKLLITRIPRRPRYKYRLPGEPCPLELNRMTEGRRRIESASPDPAPRSIRPTSVPGGPHNSSHRPLDRTSVFPRLASACSRARLRCDSASRVARARLHRSMAPQETAAASMTPMSAMAVTSSIKLNPREANRRRATKGRYRGASMRSPRARTGR